MRFGRKDYDARITDSANLIDQDEPVFLLRAQDKIAWKIVRIYAWWAQDAGYDQVTVEKASRQAELMKIWKTKKKADIK
jgi:hypothetical protein